VGLMKGVFPLSKPHPPGWISFAKSSDIGWQMLERVDLDLGQFYAKPGDDLGEIYWCLVTDLSLEELKRIKEFR